MKIGIDIEYLRNLLQHSKFLNKMHLFVHSAAVSAELIEGEPIVINDLAEVRKAISPFKQVFSAL